MGFNQKQFPWGGGGGGEGNGYFPTSPSDIQALNTESSTDHFLFTN